MARLSPEVPIGTHLLLELGGCPFPTLDSPELVREALNQAIEASGSGLIEIVCHRFSPQGVTALALIAESHLSIHTWPEHGYAAVDFFRCGAGAPLDPVEEVLVRALGAKSQARTVVHRGLPRVLRAG